MNDVVSFGSPGNIVGVAKGVDLERADIGGKQREVLTRGCEHVPWIEVEEGHQEVQSDRRERADNQIGEDVVAKSQRGAFRQLPDDNVDCRKGIVNHDDAEGHK